MPTVFPAMGVPSGLPAALKIMTRTWQGCRTAVKADRGKSQREADGWQPRQETRDDKNLTTKERRRQQEKWKRSLKTKKQRKGKRAQERRRVRREAERAQAERRRGDAVAAAAREAAWQREADTWRFKTLQAEGRLRRAAEDAKAAAEQVRRKTETEKVLRKEREELEREVIELREQLVQVQQEVASVTSSEESGCGEPQLCRIFTECRCDQLEVLAAEIPIDCALVLEWEPEVDGEHYQCKVHYQCRNEGTEVGMEDCECHPLKDFWNRLASMIGSDSDSDSDVSLD